LSCSLVTRHCSSMTALHVSNDMALPASITAATSAACPMGYRH
jgi:hypothetical protein